jgi:hypothetical protein
LTVSRCELWHPLIIPLSPHLPALAKESGDTPGTPAKGLRPSALPFKGRRMDLTKDDIRSYDMKLNNAYPL